MKNKTILIVDDINFIVAFETALIESLAQEIAVKIEIDSAFSVKEALSKIATNSYDAIVVDITLPDGSGIDIAKAVQSDSPHTRIAALTIYPYNEKEHSPYFELFFKKPISPVLFKKNLKTLLNL